MDSDLVDSNSNNIKLTKISKNERTNKTFEYKMCKKVSELMQVIHLLFVKSHELEHRNEMMKNVFEKTLNSLNEDNDRKLNELKEKYENNSKLLADLQMQLQHSKDEHKRMVHEYEVRLNQLNEENAKLKQTTNTLTQLPAAPQQGSSKAVFVLQKNIDDEKIEFLKKNNADLRETNEELKRKIKKLEKLISSEGKIKVKTKENKEPKEQKENTQVNEKHVNKEAKIKKQQPRQKGKVLFDEFYFDSYSPTNQYEQQSLESRESSLQRSLSLIGNDNSKALKNDKGNGHQFDNDSFNNSMQKSKQSKKMSLGHFDILIQKTSSQLSFKTKTPTSSNSKLDISKPNIHRRETVSILHTNPNPNIELHNKYLKFPELKKQKSTL